MSNARMPKASASDTQLNAGAIDGLVAQLRAHGFCQVEGMETPEAIADLLRGFGPLVWHRDSDATGVTFLSAHQAVADRPGYAGFGAQALLPHTDRSTLVVPPRLLAMAWQTPAPAGGDLSIHDFARILPNLRRNHPEIVKLMMDPMRIRYDDGEHLFDGPILEEVSARRYRLRFRVDGNGYYRFIDSPLISILMQEINRVQQPLRLQPGQLVIIDNHRCLHSRTHYCGDRLVLRVLADTDHLPIGFEEIADAA